MKLSSSATLTGAVLVLWTLGLPACKSDRKQIRHTPCKKIAERAGQCQQVVLQLMKKRGLTERRKHKAEWARLELKSLTSEAACKKRVAAVLKYLDRDCSKYANRRPCDGAKKRHKQRIKALKRCFTHSDCTRVARCFLDEYVR